MRTGSNRRRERIDKLIDSTGWAFQPTLFFCHSLKEWKTDKYIRTSLIQDVTVKILDKTGKELATASFTSDEVIGDVALAFRSKIEAWFSEPKIVEALK